jgi:hypothetical protein
MSTKHSPTTTSVLQDSSLEMEFFVFSDQGSASFPYYVTISTIRKDPSKSRCEVVRGALCKMIITLCENGQTKNILEHIKREAPKDTHDCTEANLTLEDIKEIQVRNVPLIKPLLDSPLPDHMCGPRPAWRRSTRGGLV